MGTDSLNYVDFLIYVEGNALGIGESYCVLPSHLTRVRGLKPISIDCIEDDVSIAPNAGARIETIG